MAWIMNFILFFHSFLWFDVQGFYVQILEKIAMSPSAQMKIIKYKWTMDSGYESLNFNIVSFDSANVLPIHWLIAFTGNCMWKKPRMELGTWKFESTSQTLTLDSWKQLTVTFYVGNNWTLQRRVIRLNFISTFDFICEYLLSTYKLIIWEKKKEKIPYPKKKFVRYFVICKMLSLTVIEMPTADRLIRICQFAKDSNLHNLTFHLNRLTQTKRKWYCANWCGHQL